VELFHSTIIMALSLFLLAFWCSYLPNPVSAGSLADIDHVVLFMQENRAFDHVSFPVFVDFKYILISDSILEPWLVSEDFKIRMFKLPTENQSFISMCY
jgi:hypothetical protein